MSSLLGKTQARFAAPPRLPDGLELLDLIGSGGAGDVYRVRELTGKLLALKVLNIRWEDQELESLAALRDLPPHPAVTRLFHVGRLASGEVFYSMELADNAGTDDDYCPDTLASRLADGGLPAADALAVVTSATEGAVHLHAHGLSHGDIKPENIIFVDGNPKLADFGTIAPNASGGTAGFLPPDPKTGADRDCYALGMTLYCAWTGLDAAEFPSLPETFDPRTGKLIREVYLRAASPRSGRRFSSPEKLLKALRRAENDLFHPHGIWKHATAIAITGILSIAGTAVTVLHSCGKSTPRPVGLREAPECKYVADDDLEIMEREVDLIKKYLTLKPYDFRTIDRFRLVFEDFRRRPDAYPDVKAFPGAEAHIRYYEDLFRDRDRWEQLHGELKMIANEYELLKRSQATGFVYLTSSLISRAKAHKENSGDHAAFAARLLTGQKPQTD